MVDKKSILIYLAISVVNQIHNLHKQLKLYIFQASSDSLYKICKTFNFLFSVSCTSVLWGILSMHTPLWRTHLILLASGLTLCPHTKSQGYFCTNKLKEISNIKLLNTVSLLEIYWLSLQWYYCSKVWSFSKPLPALWH